MSARQNKAIFHLLEKLTGQYWVDLVSHWNGTQRRAEHFKVVEYQIPPQCAAAYFPETNVLVPIDSTSDLSNQPASKSIIVTIEPAPN